MSDLEGAIVLVVRDVESAIRWYRYVLSFRVESERRGINGLPLEVALWRSGGPRLVLVWAKSAPAGLAGARLLALTSTDDLAGVAERAATLDEAPVSSFFERAGSTRQLRLHDPDGHTLVLVNPGTPHQPV